MLSGRIMCLIYDLFRRQAQARYAEKASRDREMSRFFQISVVEIPRQTIDSLLRKYSIMYLRILLRVLETVYHGALSLCTIQKVLCQRFRAKSADVLVHTVSPSKQLDACNV